ncbi:undecaprenyl/decaprenyl-phosphate alpha-N-acetylglucosaminyl 1-phosphate transferase [Clostridium sp. 19966]|uniref:MraY family glycosyltransferase n=1 Tax=Clostridium sp. 19966 TaxID=2768166 RepID=UPI0028DF6284|nr:MraY family glycosyltransferase [Clostridium sp. 19966]MDT8715594.1 undecaprenyl/decaprenyl-phosphate alpha-N-acetylglucosaminyl 1-phosphate transferase [Clostridium sp. 19966]
MDNLFFLSAIAAIISFLITPLVRKLAFKFKAVDIPRGGRKIHKVTMPRWGGISIYVSFIVVILIKNGDVNIKEWGIVLGAFIILIGGMLDDRFELRPHQKLIFQLLASIVVIAMGLKIEVLTNPLSIIDPSISIGPILSIPMTIIWIIGITNALNLMDGLDGLSAGISLISCLTIMIISIMKDNIGSALITAILSGSIIGFLPYNFHPASIFLGDTGAQLLGFLLATISIEGAVKSAAAFAIVVPILTMALPIFDTLFAIIRRKINGKPISEGDRGHMHHRLLDMGFTQKQAVMVMYLISAVLSGIAVIAIQMNSTASYVLLFVVTLIIALVCWKLGFFKRQQ